jgi:hypothetical protein
MAKRDWTRKKKEGVEVDDVSVVGAHGISSPPKYI